RAARPARARRHRALGPGLRAFGNGRALLLGVLLLGVLLARAFLLCSVLWLGAVPALRGLRSGVALGVLVIGAFGRGRVGVVLTHAGNLPSGSRARPLRSARGGSVRCAARELSVSRRRRHRRTVVRR